MTKLVLWLVVLYTFIAGPHVVSARAEMHFWKVAFSAGAADAVGGVWHVFGCGDDRVMDCGVFV